MFAVFGVAYSFGAFFSSMADEFGASSGATALVFSITISLSFILGLWTGRWSDAKGPRPVVLTGAAFLFVGLLLTAATPSLWLGYITYGVGVGVAIACGYVPMVATVGGWFERRRAAALGISVAGIGLGTLIASPLAAALIDRTSWRRAYVIFAFGGAAVMVFAAFVAERGPAAVEAARPRSLATLWSSFEFRVLYLSVLFASFGVFVPFVFLASYAEGRGTDPVRAALLVGLIGGASVLGRLGLGVLADRGGSMRLYFVSFILMSVGHAIWLAAGSSYPILVVYAIWTGVGYGGFIALSPAVAAEVFGLDGLGGVIGTLYTAAGVGGFAGPPIAGWLIDRWGDGAGILVALAGTLIGTVVLSSLMRTPPRNTRQYRET
ncbi:MAG: MFS transporter [Acidimicrobiales bacterium]